MAVTRTADTRGYAKGRAKRQEIIEVALELFGQGGYRSTSLREVAARCGISHPGLLHHFPTKEALLMEVLRYRDDLDTAHTFRGRQRGTALLLALVDLAERNSTRRPIVELFSSLATEASDPGHPAHGYFVERYRMVRGLFLDALAQAGADGDLRPGVDHGRAMLTLTAIMDGLQVHWLLAPDEVDMVGPLRDYLALILTPEALGRQVADPA